jgi:hypothetical protein
MSNYDHPVQSHPLFPCAEIFSLTGLVPGASAPFPVGVVSPEAVLGRCFNMRSIRTPQGL